MWLSIDTRARVDRDCLPEVDLDVADNERPDCPLIALAQHAISL